MGSLADIADTLARRLEALEAIPLGRASPPSNAEIIQHAMAYGSAVQALPNTPEVALWLLRFSRIHGRVIAPPAFVSLFVENGAAMMQDFGPPCLANGVYSLKRRMALDPPIIAFVPFSLHGFAVKWPEVPT